MANMSDPRVIAILAHARACKEAKWFKKSRPPLPHELKDLSGIDLTNASLGDTDLEGVDLTGANLTGAIFGKTNLINANLTGANLTRASLNDSDLTGANLTDANLTKAYIGFADLTDAKITQDQIESSSNINVAYNGYPVAAAKKFILLHEPSSGLTEAKKRLVVELRSDGKLHIKTPIFKY